MTRDWIEIRGLRIESHIGVPDDERASTQGLLVDVRIQPLRDFSAMPDALEATADYFAISERIKTLAGARPRKLIETLADEIASTVLREFAVLRAEVTVRKFILPDTEHVAVHCERERNR